MIQILFLLLSTSLFAFGFQKPYKIVVITDEESKERAEEFKNYLLQKPPFSKMAEKLDIKIVSLKKEEMDCKNSNPDSPRIISCDYQKLQDVQSKEVANLAVAFTASGSGGSGGNIPIASKDYPIQTMFHEMLHAYGLDDEYDYSANEKTVYCSSPRNSANLVYFKDKPPYSDDAAARKTHKNDVPWMSGISQTKMITEGLNLGSENKFEKNGEQTMGLYRGGACSSADLPGWRPYLNSIMKGYLDDTIYPFYEEVIVRNIESSLGRKLNLPPPTVTCLDILFNYNQIHLLQSQAKDILFQVTPGPKMKPGFRD